eukprot:PITA_18696
MVEEYSSIMTNDVWEIVPRPEHRSVVGSRWIYKIKYATDDNIDKCKARFVAKGYAQKEGIDYEETFALVARYTSIRSIIFLAAQMGWEIHQMDVKAMFLKGVIEEELGFIKSDADPNLYYVLVEGEPLILVLYVDDLLLTGSLRLIEDCKKNLEIEFDMKDLGLMHYFLGLEVWQQNCEIFLGQGRYASKILKRLRMQDYQPMAMPMITNWKKIDACRDKEVDPTLYRRLIGSLMYLVNTRLDICYAVNTLSQFMVEPKRAHWVAKKHILKYVQGIVNFGLRYTNGDDIELSGFTDANWAGSSVEKKSTTGYCLGIGSRMTSWCSKNQKFVALSLAEAEYMAASKAMCEAIWVRKLLVNLLRKRMEATKIFCDN